MQVKTSNEDDPELLLAHGTNTEAEIDNLIDAFNLKLTLRVKTEFEDEKYNTLGKQIEHRARNEDRQNRREN